MHRDSLHIGFSEQQIAPRSYYEQRELFSGKASLFSLFYEQQMQWGLLEFVCCLDNGTSNFMEQKEYWKRNKLRTQLILLLHTVSPGLRQNFLLNHIYHKMLSIYLCSENDTYIK